MKYIHSTVDAQTKASVGHSQEVVKFTTDSCSHERQDGIIGGMAREELEDLILPVPPWLNLSKC